MKYGLLIILFLISGCTDLEEPKDSGSLRYQIFLECMELAAKLQSPAQSLSTTESEVGDVVYECSNQAYYMAKHIKTAG